MRWVEDYIRCHDGQGGVILSRMAPALSLTLHALLILTCLFAGDLGNTAQVLVRPVTYEVALVTLEDAGGSGHEKSCALEVDRVESALPRQAAVKPKPRIKAASKPVAPPQAAPTTKQEPVPDASCREIAAAVDAKASRVSPPIAEARKEVSSEGDSFSGRASSLAKAINGPTSPKGLAQGIGNGLGKGELQGGIGQVDILPRIVRKVEPRYPVGAREGGVTGSVSVKFLVDRRGRVQEPQVVTAQPEGVFEQSALSAVRRWRFKAAKKDGQRVATWVVLPIRFSLE